MSDRKFTVTYKIVRALVDTFYPRYEIVGAETLPKEGIILVGNHSQMDGPIVGELSIPDPHRIWCVEEMMYRKQVPVYAFRDFWSQKPKWSHPFYRFLAYLIAPISAALFRNPDTIAVYRDARIKSTFKQTISALEEGANVIIFPEHDEPHNQIVYDFQRNFVDVARLYHRRTKKELAFVPMYIAPAFRKVYLGKAIRYCPDASLEEERERICRYCMDEITAIAVSLPEHTVVPYRNFPKKLRPKNTDHSWQPPRKNEDGVIKAK